MVHICCIAADEAHAEECVSARCEREMSMASECVPSVLGVFVVCPPNQKRKFYIIHVI